MVDSFNSLDVHDINELGKELNPKFDSLFHVDKINNNENIYVYRIDECVVGFIHISCNYEVCDLLNIIVDKNYRNKGIATSLMNIMISELSEEQEKIMLEVRASNEDAIAFYKKFNFEVISTRKNYYDGTDALVMEMKLK